MNFFIHACSSFWELISQFDATIAVIFASVVAYTQFRFQSIHTRRLLIIEEAYEKLVMSSESFKSLTNPWQEAGELNKEEKIKIFIKHANEMIDFLNKKQLFFSTQEIKYIEAIKKKMSESWRDYKFKEDIKDDNSLVKERLDLWTKVWNSADNEIPKLIKSLEKEFKTVVGLD